MADDARRDGPQAREDDRIDPLGRALRETYDAENHDTLGNDVTGLMIDLSKVPYDPQAVPPASATPSPHRLRPTLLEWIGSLLAKRRPSR